MKTLNDLKVKIFADGAEKASMMEMHSKPFVQGLTTNPTLIAKAGKDFIEVTREICGLVDGPVSAEVVALDHEGMMREAEILRKIADNVCIKVPLTIDGLKTCKALTSDGTMVNVGAPPEPLPVRMFTLFNNRRSFAGSTIGGIAETQEMLDFCAEHGVVPEVELISADQINEAYERVLRSDVRYRFVIDTATL